MPLQPGLSQVSRRALLSRVGLGSVAIAAIGISHPEQSAAEGILRAPGVADNAIEFEGFEASLNGAYSFLDRMMDAYAAGSTVRLIQSYSDAAFGAFAVAFTYDNAVAIQAYLARRSASDMQRAEVLGNGLIYAQANNFPFADGRFAQAYYVNVPASSGGPYITPAANPFYFYASAVGDQAWAGMALARLYQATGNGSYLTAALKVANWIVNNTYNTAGFGGYLYGTFIATNNTSQPSGNGQSTEHNIDTYAFFTMLAQLTNNAQAQNGMSWSNLANHALQFVQAMFDTTGGFFWTGTTGPGTASIFTSNIPEDVQTWSYLALENKTYGVSIDWVKTNLATTDTPQAPFGALKGLGNIRIQGETYASDSLAANPANADPHAVWLEGTAHTVAAMLARELSPFDDIPLFYGDLATAIVLLQNVRLAQSNLGAGQTVNSMPIPLGEGVVAASGTLNTGFNFDYYPNLHIGATGWYAIAVQAANPFRLGRGTW